MHTSKSKDTPVNLTSHDSAPTSCDTAAFSCPGTKKGCPPAPHRTATKQGWPPSRTGPLKTDSCDHIVQQWCIYTAQQSCNHTRHKSYNHTAPTPHTSRITTSHTSRMTTQHTIHETTPHLSRTSTPHTSRATTLHTPAQEKDRHARITPPCGKSEGACTEQPCVDLGKKRNKEDQCACQEHIMQTEAKEKGTPRREDRCSCQTRCTQTASHVLAARAASTYLLQTYLPPTHTSTIPCIIPRGWM